MDRGSTAEEGLPHDGSEARELDSAGDEVAAEDERGPREAAARDATADEAAPGMGGFEGIEGATAGEERTGQAEGSVAQLEGLQEEIQALNDRHLRLAAEFDNYRKRVNRERDDMRRRSEAELAARLLDALDDLRRVSSFEAGSTTVESLHEGVELVEKKLRRALEGAGLEPIDAEGEFFNPETMEAIMTAPAEHPEEDDVVDEVFQRGYRFHGILLRPARVRVKKYEE